MYLAFFMFLYYNYFKLKIVINMYKKKYKDDIYSMYEEVAKNKIANNEIKNLEPILIHIIIEEKVVPKMVGRLEIKEKL